MSGPERPRGDVLLVGRATRRLALQVAGLVALAKGSLGADAAAVRNLQPISAVGLTGSSDGSAATFDLRLTTR